MAIKTILVPTDFSDASGSALACAKEFAGAFGASLHLLHIIHDVLGRPAMAEAVSSATIRAQLDQMRQEAGQELNKALTADEIVAYRATTAIEEGNPVTKILDYAQTHKADLIVMGTHGRGPLAHALFGSVAERIVRLAPCPVVTVKHT